MINFNEHMADVIDNDKRWGLLNILYNKNYLNKKSRWQKIPKIIHQIWLGGELPDKYKFYINTLKTINPDWEYRLWSDSDVSGFKLKNISLFDNISNLGSKSDIFRYEILQRFGGIYLDIDFYGVKSFNDLIYLRFFAGIDTSPGLLNGLIGTVPNGKIISNVVTELLTIQHFNNTIDNIMKTTGPCFLTRQFYKLINEDTDGVVVFPTKFFYPYPGDKRHIPQDSNYNTVINSFNTDNTYCVHMWHTNWQK